MVEDVVVDVDKDKEVSEVSEVQEEEDLQDKDFYS